jgi:hypothetical protein
MSSELITATASVLLAIIGVAIIAVIVSKNSNTAQVITTGGSGFASALSCALSPITGASCGSGIPNVTSTISFDGF